MQVPNDILRDFAKLVQPEPEKKDKTYYGKIVVENGETYVQLDGSSLYTPISASSVDISHEDRVIVMIKNRQAVVTGNLSAAGREKERIDELIATVEELQEQLDILQGAVSELAGDVLTSSRGTSIAANTDVDSITEPGVYYSGSAANSGTLSHPPISTSGFRMEVLQVIGSTRLMARAYQNNNPNQFWLRFYGANGWGNWYKYSGTAQT